MDFQLFRDKVFATAQALGLTDYELYFERSDAFRAAVYEGQIDQYSVSARLGVSLRVQTDGRTGYAYTEALDEAAVGMLVDMAQENARSIGVTDVSPIYQGDGEYPRIEGFHEDLNAFDERRRIELALDIEARAKAMDPRVASVQACTVGYAAGETGIVNSKGLDVRHRSNVAYAYLESVVCDGDQQRSGFFAKAAFDWKDLDPQMMAQEAVDDALSYIGAQPIPTGVYPVIIRKQAMTALLDTFSRVFVADAAQKGLSLLRDKVGEVIASPAVTIMDDPNLPGGFANTPFDAEGVRCYAKPVVEGGVLKTLLYNLKTALKDNVSSTGNAAKGSYASPVDTAPSNFYIKPGEQGLEEMMQGLGDGLMITELSGLHAGAQMQSGDFSLECKGFSIKDGKQAAPVSMITVSGNFYQLLRDVACVGADLYFDMPSGASCVGAPSVWVKALSVAGT